MQASELSLAVLVGVLMLHDQSVWAQPKWVDASPSLRGNELSVTCRGAGPSDIQASKRALEACQVEAGTFLRTDVRLKSLVVQTERDVAVHDEVSSSSIYENLSCVPGRREVEEKDQVFTIYQECRFDLSKVKIVRNSTESSDLEAEPRAAVIDKGSERLLSVSTSPQCESVIIENAEASITRCVGNPVQVRAPAGAVDLIIRAKGCFPKKIRVAPKEEDVHVSLDPN